MGLTEEDGKTREKSCGDKVKVTPTFDKKDGGDGEANVKREDALGKRTSGSGNNNKDGKGKCRGGEVEDVKVVPEAEDTDHKLDHHEPSQDSDTEAGGEVDNSKGKGSSGEGAADHGEKDLGIW